MTTRILGAILALALAPACAKNYSGDQLVAGDGGAPSAPSPPPVQHTIEYRVVGQVSEATVSYGNAQQGTTDLVTLLPWAASFKTSRTTLFVYLSAHSFEEGVLRVQIFVDGDLYREAATDGLATSVVSVSGTVQLSSTIAGEWMEIAQAPR
jgi:hypothetical protein